MDTLLRGGTIEKLDVWLRDARQSGVYGMQRFARALRHDIEAVRNAVLEPWSNGQTEGQINRLKTLKRAMYGRAGVELLRARLMPLSTQVLHRKCIRTSFLATRQLAHTTIMRWVQRYTPEFEKRWRRYALEVGRSWRVDETYVKIRGEWCYLYRAVDREGRTVDFRLSSRRDVAAAKAFFRKAVKNHKGPPQTITLDGYAASHRAVRELRADGSLPTGTKLRSSKYMNNLIEQDHRSVKQRVAVMIGRKQFRNAAITIAGIELMHRIRKGQFGLRSLGVVKGQTAPAVWNAVLGA